MDGTKSHSRGKQAMLLASPVCVTAQRGLARDSFAP